MKAVPRSLHRLVRRRRRWLAWLLLGLVATVAALGFVPWRQTVSGTGRVAVFSAMDRPQPIEAQISGRIAEWRVQEGALVKEGEVVARLVDIDPKYLDAEQPERLREQRDLVRLSQSEAERRVRELQNQRASLVRAREEALGAARQGIAQAEGRRRALAQALRQSEAGSRIAAEVAAASARERAGQADDRVVQAEQAVAAAEGALETARLRRERVAGLFAQGLRSRQDDEFAENDLLKARTEGVRAKKGLEIARRDANVGALGQSGASFERERAAAAVAQARANLEVADRDILAARLNLARLASDTSAGLSRVDADVQSARESAAKNAGDVRKVEIDLGNLGARTRQQIVRAPRAGRIVRLQAGGAGSTVKAGDVLATLAPQTADRVVELTVGANDAPLVQAGTPVRLQFAGWPAVQSAGVPALSVGTFGGRVAFVDPVDDGKGGFRVVVRPDRQRFPSGRMDGPWPDPARLRPGAPAFGWLMLREVPLGFELWRQLNGFPPQPSSPSSKPPGPIKLKGK